MNENEEKLAQLVEGLRALCEVIEARNRYAPDLQLPHVVQLLSATLRDIDERCGAAGGES